MNSPNSEFHRLVKPVSLFLGLLLLVPLIGFSVVHLNEPKIRESAYENLNSIARLRASEIESWLDERESNLKLLAAGEGFVFNAKRFVQTGNTDSRAFVVRRLDAYSKARYYQSALLLNTNGQVVAAAGKPADTTAPIFQSLIKSAMKSGHVEHSVLYRDAITKNIHLDFVLPLPGAEGQPAPALVLLNAPADHFLFPLIQTWPSSSPSSETLLVRRDGNDVLFLNELRHRKGTALSLRIPLSDTNVPAVAAVLE